MVAEAGLVAASLTGPASTLRCYSRFGDRPLKFLASTLRSGSVPNTLLGATLVTALIAPSLEAQVGPVVS